MPLASANPKSLLKTPPIPTANDGLAALKAMLPSVGEPLSIDMMGALQAFHRNIGDIFMVNAPRLRIVVLAGPEAGRMVYVTRRHDFQWRSEGDAVVRLLRHGVLIVDGEEHDRLRALMEPPLRQRNLDVYVPSILRHTAQVAAGWAEGDVRDMLPEMRRIALLILVDTLFGVDLTPDLDRIWQPILKAISYISPGPWLFWPDMPRPAYARPLADLDAYLYQIIRDRRQTPRPEASDLLSVLVSEPGLSDDLIRDQLLTMLIAGHDTSTALLSWTLLLLGQHPDTYTLVRAEIDQEISDRAISPDAIRRLTLLEQVIKEALRLYPPIHASLRKAATDIEFGDYCIPAGSRVLYSIYLTQRDPAHWQDAGEFCPERFAPGSDKPAAFTYVPFGGGPRNCIGGAYGKFETQAVLAWLLQHFDFHWAQRSAHAHMGATLEPRPGVLMAIHPRLPVATGGVTA